MLSFPFASESVDAIESAPASNKYSLKNDKWIKAQATERKLIRPFVPQIIREQVYEQEGYSLHRKVISYGLSSYGYDIRLSPNDFRIFRHIPGTIIDPKKFNPDNLEQALLHFDDNGEYFILPGHSYGLGVAFECLSVPDNITVICMGKSTYARTGLIVNTTPGEAGWRGHLTLEFSNSSNADCRIYAGEGIAQLLFFEGEVCETSYEKRKGKYQDQSHEVTLAMP